MTDTAPALPSLLEGVRIIDTSSVLFGPYATQWLGDLGADVVKVEGLDGDNTRHIGPARHAGMGAVFFGANRNKRSIAVDMKHPEGRRIMLDLCADADVFVTNIRRLAVQRLGLGYAALAAHKPGLIYAHAVGYRQGGPYEDAPAFDDTIQAISGLAALQGTVSGEPTYVASAVADKVSGLTLALAIVAALRHRDRSGEGQYIEVPMFETVVAFNLVEHQYGRVFDPPTGPAVYPRVVSPHRRPYATTDGHVAVMPYTDAHWRKFFALIGQPELAQDSRFSGIGARTRHIDALYALVAVAMAGRSTRDWLLALGQAEVPAVAVQSTEDLFDDEHLRATDFFRAQQHPSEGAIVQVSPPVHFSRTPARLHRHAPRLGEHSQEILRGLGYAEDRIASLVAQGAVSLAPDEPDEPAGG